MFESENNFVLNTYDHVYFFIPYIPSVSSDSSVELFTSMMFVSSSSSVSTMSTSSSSSLSSSSLFSSLSPSFSRKYWSGLEKMSSRIH